MMENRHLYKIEFICILGSKESEQLNVTALNLFQLTTSPHFGGGRYLLF